MKRSPWQPKALVLILALLGVSPMPLASAPDAGAALDWIEGEWEGVRRDADSEVPMGLVVISLPGDAGFFERLEVATEPRPYVGVSVLTFDEASESWVKLYTNPVRSKVARLEGRLEGESLVLLSVTPGRSRESRLSATRTGPDTWRREQAISRDGGKTWQTLFVDELRRVKN